jgi:ABC-type dipeptide/oligopeptide/nickel transport system permease subunit
MPRRGAWVKGWLRSVISNIEAKLGLGILILFTLMAISHPILLRTVWPRWIYDPRSGFDMELHHPSLPSWSHWLGTDAFGKDTFSMLLAGTRPALIAGVIAGLLTAASALFVAAASAAWRPADRVLGMVVDAGLYLPVPIVMLMFGADPQADRLTPLMFGIIFGILTGISSGALVLRSQALPIMTSGYVDAARVAGASKIQLIGRHLIPSLVPIACAYAVLGAVGAIVTQGFLSWLSYTATYNDWGTLVYWAIVTRDFTGDLLWHVLIAAGAALTLLTLGFHLLSIGFRRAAAKPWSSLPPTVSVAPVTPELVSAEVVSIS